MERDSFVFYRSFFEALSCLDKEQKADCLDAIARYALDGEDPDVEGIVKALFISVKPQIDANNRRYANGCKGGKPKVNQNVTKEKPKANQTATEPKPNENVNDNDNENDNENVNVNEKKKKPTVKKKKPEEDKKPYGSNQHVELTDKEHDMLVTEYGVIYTQKLIEYLDGYLEEKPGYKTKSHYRTIKRWVVDAVNEQEKRRKPPNIQQSTNDWFAECFEEKPK